MKASKYGVNVRLERFFLLPLTLLAIVLVSFTEHSFAIENEDEFVVVLDAGHGGHDPGNLGNGYLEKNIALNIVLKAGSILEKTPGVKVIYTRKDDTFVDLYVRGEIANKAGADLFVSVHCDSHSSKAYGAGTFVLGLHANKQNFEIAKKENSVIYLEDNYRSRYANYDINSPESVIGLTIMQEEFLDQSIALAKAIQDNFTQKLKRKDRKVKQAGFIVLHQTVMPSVLVETGFLTNPEEGAYLNSKKGQSEMGSAIAEAVLTYKGAVMANMADAQLALITDTPSPTTSNNEEPVVVEAVPQKNKSSTQLDTQKENTDGDDGVRANVEKDTDEKATAQIIDEARKKAERSSPSSGKTGVGTSVSEKAPIAAVSKTSEKIEKNHQPEPKEGVIYKVQIMASSKNIPLKPSSFNGLNRVVKEPYKDMFRYVYGSTKSLEEAKMMKSNADIKGYPTSFIVAYRNGERIPFKESLK
ncbi:N-acetylmuramoyl-L-alanine amidase family protein [Pareuzebyella sediminis]|uniref:N-acetylmuramoyl-L-alanine amidase family protein n=1 Tax=Pareuzebyella sediminis TaxID=2607998 RepID=UPI0011EE9AF1|nr:N-acetylmuramoyl-L-alanine amidase [Pareuzebyella sediminis]